MSYPPPPEGESSPQGGEPGAQGYGQQQPYGYGPGRAPHDPGEPSYGPGYWPPGYGSGPPHYQQGYYPGWPRPEHPDAVPSLVVGLIALVGGLSCFGLPFALGPWAWAKGRRTLNEIDASGGQLGGRGMAQAAYVCGVVATVFLALGILTVIFVVLTAAVPAMAGSAG